MTEENETILLNYLEIIARQLEFIAQTNYLTLTQNNPNRTPWEQIRDQEIYYTEEEEE